MICALRDAHGRRRGPRLQDADVRHRQEGSCSCHLGEWGTFHRKDLVVDMDPFWSSQGDVAVARAGLRAPEDGREYRISQERMNGRAQGVPVHQLRVLRLGVQRDGVGPRVLGPQALAKGMRFVGDRARRRDRGRLERYNSEHGIWDCTRLLLLQRALPEGSRPPRRHREARRRSRSALASTATWELARQVVRPALPRRRAGCARRS